jgi:hypothetical protein
MHGAATAGNYEHLGRHQGAFDLADLAAIALAAAALGAAAAGLCAHLCWLALTDWAELCTLLSYAVDVVRV